jgi:hypothetical protein
MTTSRKSSEVDMSKQTGGPAFPRPHSGTSQFAQQGMTLRDYFAAKAMQAILSDPNYINPDEKLAEASYSIADAMLKAREA